jgi:hypothetical protein
MRGDATRHFPLKVKLADTQQPDWRHEGVVPAPADFRTRLEAIILITSRRSAGTHL